MKDAEVLTFGQRVKQIRLGLGFSQKDFAASLDISASFLSEVESGKSKAGYDFLFNISKVYHVDLNYLLRGGGRPFTAGSGSGTIDQAELGEYGGKIFRMLNDMKRSELLKLAVLEFYIKFMMENEDYLKKESERAKRDGGGSPPEVNNG
jgi:transcriptional regulator with XRE-family HTH domain